MNDKLFDWEFDTFNDPALVKLLERIEEWCKLPNSKKSILTISGPTERGKTHLAKKVKELFSRFDSVFPKRKQNYQETIFVTWSDDFIRTTMDIPNRFDEIKHSGLVVIDDFLSGFYESDTGSVIPKHKWNGWHTIVITKAFDILTARVGKPTFITTNISEKDIELLIDDRIHSRLFREGGIFINIPKKVQKYLTR